MCIRDSLGLGLAAASLVGQALGRGDADDAEAWGWDVVKVTVAVIVVLGLPMAIAPEVLLAGFLDNPETIAIAALPLRISGLTLAVDGVALVLLNSLIGAGATRTVMVVSVLCQWLIGLVGAYIMGPVLGFGLLGIWAVQVGYRLIQGTVFAVVWKRGRWRDIKV